MSYQFEPCGTDPRIDPIFGPTASSFYWSATSLAGILPFNAWFVFFGNGFVSDGEALGNFSVRAVRGGL